MTETETALRPLLTRLSMISCWAAGSPEGGLRKTTSAPTSPAALLQPFSTMVQNGSGLLLTKPTRTFAPPAVPAAEVPEVLALLHAARASGRRARSGRRKRLMVRGLAFHGRESGPGSADENTATPRRGKWAGPLVPSARRHTVAGMDAAA